MPATFLCFCCPQGHFTFPFSIPATGATAGAKKRRRATRKRRKKTRKKKPTKARKKRFSGARPVSPWVCPPEFNHPFSMKRGTGKEGSEAQGEKPREKKAQRLFLALFVGDCGFRRKPHKDNTGAIHNANYLMRNNRKNRFEEDAFSE